MIRDFKAQKSERALFRWLRLRWKRFVRPATYRRMFDGDPLAFITEPLPPSLTARVRGEQISQIARNTPLMMVATGFNALVFGIVMRHSPLAPFAYLWTAMAFTLASYLYVRRVNSKKRLSRTASVRGIHKAILYALLHGGLWGLMPAVFFAGGSPAQHLVIVCLIAGMLCGGAFALSPVPIVTFAYVAPIILGSTYAIAGSEDVYSVIAALMVVYTIVLIGASNLRALTLARRCIAETRAESSAITDGLTQLPNRAALERRMQEAIARYKRCGEPFALMCFDLDCFKTINDTLGHAAGDQALIEAAHRLKNAARDVDMVARIGGDEFALIAANVQSKAEAVAIADRIVNLFQQHVEIEGRSWPLTVSIGVALAPSDGSEVDVLMRNSDAALYSTKQTGRGDYTFFSDHYSYVIEQETLAGELRRALGRHELYLVFQPLIDAVTTELTGLEALLRWRHPTRGELGADQIVPLLERTGLIDEVGGFITREAIAIAVTWPKHLRLAVNISPLQLRRSTLETAIRDSVKETGFETTRLELEITESAIISDRTQAVAALGSLRALGVKTALDDFGTGYSSLTNVVELPFDRLKIDRSFVSKIESEPLCASVVKASLELARATGLRATAEGVETAAQFEFVRKYGCDEVQGYFFSEPISPNEIPALYRKLQPANLQIGS
jgi:diguanylate cyclase (GGDEF)-like protein